MAEIIFLDFEASSLGDESWPIELGVCWLDNQEKLRTYIRPLLLSIISCSGPNENRALVAYRPFGMNIPCACQHSQGPV